jgi:hypothetical protein
MTIIKINTTGSLPQCHSFFSIHSLKIEFSSFVGETVKVHDGFQLLYLTIPAFLSHHSGASRNPESFPSIPATAGIHGLGGNYYTEK